MYKSLGAEKIDPILKAASSLAKPVRISSFPKA